MFYDVSKVEEFIPLSYINCSAWFVEGWGFNPSLIPPLSTPKFSLTPTDLVKTQKYIEMHPLWFYHKSSTGYLNISHMIYTV